MTSIPESVYDSYAPEVNGEYRFIESIAPKLKVAFDVGGNVGDHSRMIRRFAPNCRIVIFEPFTDCLPSLQSIPGAEVHSVAVGEYFGEVTIHKNTWALGMSSIYRVWPNTTPVTVPQVTIDYMMGMLKLDHVDFLKVDTEGNELNVFIGANISLRRKAFSYIQFEYGGTYPDAHITLEQVFTLLKSFGYSMGVIYPDGVIPTPEWDPAFETNRYSNWVATICPTS